MENMTEQEICNFVKVAIKTLEEEKKEEVMKCVGQFVHNPKIDEINQKIASFQKQCKHLDTTLKNSGKCPYCGKQIMQTR